MQKHENATLPDVLARRLAEALQEQIDDLAEAERRVGQTIDQIPVEYADLPPATGLGADARLPGLRTIKLALAAHQRAIDEFLADVTESA